MKAFWQETDSWQGPVGVGRVTGSGSDGWGYAQSLIQFSVDGRGGCLSSLLFVPSLQMATHSSILAWKIPW